MLARWVDEEGGTNEVEGIVERNATFWLDDLPLIAGTNEVVISAENAAGLSGTTTLPIARSDITLEVGTLPGDFYMSFLTISGTISDPGCSITVNGTNAVVDPYGCWTAEHVPVMGEGTATFDIVATPAGGTQDPVGLSVQREKEAAIRVATHYAVSRTTFNPWEWHGWTKTYTASYREGLQSYKGTTRSKMDIALTGYQMHQVTDYTWSDDNEPGTWHNINESGESWGALNPETSFVIKSVPDAQLDHDGHYVHHLHAQGVRHRWDDPASEQRLVARTTLKLHTGGKSGIARKSLLCINALTAAGYQMPEMAPWYHTPTYNIPFQSIQVLGKPLGNDGKLWTVQPDNATVSLNLKAPARHYTVNAAVEKHRLFIRANGVWLADDRVRPQARFVVGEKVELDTVVSPALQCIQEKQGSWTLSGQFVNDFNAYDAFGQQLDVSFYDLAWSLKDFRVSDSWLRKEHTRAWWLTGGSPFENKQMKVGLHVLFTNGQQATIAARGLLGMHRPTITWDANSYQAGVVVGRIAQIQWVHEDGSTGSIAALQVKLGQFGTENDRLQVAVESASLFPGRIGCTQLILRDSLPEAFSDWRLDNTFPYTWNRYGPPTSEGTYYGAYVLGDGPGPCAFGGYMWDRFKQFFQFRSDKPGSIWVTLGTAEWEWRGDIMYSSTKPEGWEWISDPYCIHSQFLAADPKHPEWFSRKSNVDF